jgi:uncharacterized membrane protein
MVLQLLFGFIGLIIGALILDEGGWLFGALLGFLITKVLQMGQQVKDQAKEISLLKSMQEYLHLTIRSLQSSANDQTDKMKSDQQEASEKETLEKEIVQQEMPRSKTQAGYPQAEEEPIAAREITSEPFQVSKDTPSYLASNVSSGSAHSSPIVTTKSTATPRATIPKQPATPGLGDKIGDAIRNFFIGGNPVVRVGMLVLFFGLSFLAKYAAGQGYFPIELRLSCIALIAIALIFFGWKTRNREGGYGLVLQGGGLAALYLTSFAAAKMYGVIPSSAALVLLFVFVIFGAILALLQNAQVLAIISIAGGFLAPILTSDGSGNHVGLFSVYLILNVGIFAISWFKTWRLLNWIGFLFTFSISVFWGVSRYEPQFYASSQPFLIAFFFLYLIISILFSLKQPPNLKGLVDGSLVFGLPVAAFSLQVALLKHTEYGLAISALVLAFIYVLLARWLWTRYLQTHKLLAESFLALGVGFATLAIPLGLNADWTSATWAFEAAGLLWIGLRQQRILPRFAGVGLYYAACIATLADNGFSAGATPIITGDFISGFILSLSGFLMAYCFFRFSEFAFKIELWVGKFILILAIIWWMAVIILELDGHLSRVQKFAIFYILAALSLYVQLTIAHKLNWSSLGKAGHIYFIFVGIWTLVGFIAHTLYFPSDWMLGLPFVVFLSSQYYFLWRLEKGQWTFGLQFAHLASSLLVLLLLLWQANGVADYTPFLQSVMPADTARLLIWFLVFVPSVLLLIGLNTKDYWPVTQWKTLYQDIIPVPFVLILIGWFFVASRESGNIMEFYLPVLNPIDLAQFAVILVVAFAMKAGLSFSHSWSATVKAGWIGTLVFVWINVVLLRAIHHYTLIAYDSEILWQSPTVQMALSILWTICALLLMNVSRRLQQRKLWITGACLLGVVVLKLAFKDLSGSSTIAGIISFMAVGVLMLLIGYLSPIPPAHKSVDADKKSGESSQ